MEEIRHRARRALDDGRAAVAAPARGEGAVVDEQVGARPRDQRGEFFEEFGRLEANRPRPVAPRRPDAQQHLAVRREFV